MTVACDYCGKPAELVGGKDVFAHRPDLYRKLFWRCSPCGAWIRHDEVKDRPTGRLANAELRLAKRLAKSAFDPICGLMSRDSCNKHRGKGRAYSWLAEQLGIPTRECDFGKFDVETCNRARAVCRKFLNRSRAA